MAEHNRKKGPMGGIGAVEKAKDFKGTLKKLMKYIGVYKVSLILVVAFALLSTAFDIIGPKILSNATTEIFNGLVSKIKGTGGIDFSYIGRILLIMLCLYFISAVFGMIQGWIMTSVAQKVSFKMRKELSDKLHRMPMKYFESRTHGEVLSRITNDVDTLGMSFNQAITPLIYNTATIIGVLIMMLSISPLMTIIPFVMLPLSGMLIGTVMKKSQKYFKSQQDYLGHINGQVEEVYSGHTVVKAFNREEEVLKEFDKNNKVLFKSALMSQFLSGILHPIMIFIGNLGYVAIAVVGAWLAITGVITVGDIQAFIIYVRQFTNPIGQIAQNTSLIQSTIAAAERVFEFLAEEEEDQFAENAVSPDKIEGNVSFEHVHFGYDSDKIIINDFSEEIKQGQKIAIAGPTGAGKTTMVKLLMRFYDVNSGEIKVDGYNLKQFNRGELRKAFGMVLQDTWLFKGSIMENIRYGRLDATDEEVIAAAKAAHAHHFIKTLPDGYNMELNEEASNVSQGQKQLLTIARAILADSRIMILDEATSSVDTRTEERIQKAMDNLMRGRTSFIIAHRLSTIKEADLILVMKDGDIIEQGTHNELLEANGFYAELYNSQFDKVS